MVTLPLQLVQERVRKMENDIDILLERVARKEEYTIGKLYINGQYFCDTLEDTDRGLRDEMSVDEILNIKIAGKTAIPTGTYYVTLGVKSAKFSTEKYKKQYGFCNGYLPRLLNVKGYSGVLIHIGNEPKDTDGCLLVGFNKAKGKVLNSTETFKKLYKILNTAKGDIRLTIK